MKVYRLLSSAALAGVLAMGLASTPVVRAGVILDDHFTSDPVSNGWTSYLQSAVANGSSTLTHDGTNEKIVVSAVADKGQGGGLTNTSAIDVSSVTSITLRMTFGQMDSTVTDGGNLRLGLFTNTSSPYLAANNPLFLAVQGSGVAVNYGNTSLSAPTGTGAFSSGVSGSVGAVGDWVEITFSQTQVTSVQYFDASANTTLSALSAPVDLGAGVTLNSAFGTAAHVGFGKLVAGGTNGVTQTMVVDRIEVSAIPEPASLGLLSLAGLLLVRRRK